jgi:FG-GAP-like repeat/Secretion system C-terminal sorting domain/Immunoglobulin domain
VLRFSMDANGAAGWFADFNYMTFDIASVPPSIVVQPASQTVTVGQSATFSTTVTGSPVLSYQWQKDLADIPGATGATYTSPIAIIADSGSAYRCTVSNTFGTVTTNDAVLSVAGNPTALAFQHHIIDINPPRDPHCKTAGDINGDGFVDVLAASSSNFTEGLFWYKYPSWTKYSIHTGSFSTDMQVADIDGDGDLDAIIPKGAEYGSSVYIYVNPLPSGNPEVGPWQEIPVGDAGAHDVEVGDINKDGKLDIVVRLDLAVTIFLQNSITSWTKVTLNTRPFEGTALGDIDGDGDLDIVINGYWLENPLPGGNPATAPWTEHLISSAWGDQVKVHVADLNGDGRLDVLFAPSEYSGANLAWYETLTPLTGPWTQHIIASNVEYVHTVKTGDMDRDGNLDVVTAEMQQSTDPDEVIVYRNNGNALSWSKVVVATTGSHNAKLADIGNDGNIDIIGANWDMSAPGGTPIEYWENLGIGSGTGSLDRWTYIHADANREQSILGNGAFGLGFGDVNGDGYKDIVSGQYYYTNPGGTMTSTPWPRVTLPTNPQSGRSLDAYLLFDAEGTGQQNDIIAEDLPSVTWLKADDTQGTTWTAKVVGQVPVTAHGNGRTVKTAHIVPWNTRPDILISGGDGTYLMQVPANPAADPWPLSKITTSSNGEQKAIGVGDIDRDGDTDIVVTKGSQQLEVDWWSNPGDSTSPWIEHIVGMTNAQAKMIDVVDVNGDGRSDVIVTEEASPASVYWFEAPIDPVAGTWTRHTVAIGLEELDSMTGLDMNYDGKPDIVVAEIFGEKRTIIFENVNNGTLWKTHIVDRGKEGHNGARVVDLNNDGRPDIVSIAYYDFADLHIWRNDAVESAQPLSKGAEGLDTTRSAGGTARPATFALHQNYPNPFNPSTRIRFEIPKTSNVRITIYDILGRQVARLSDELREPGSYEVQWNAAKSASGVYMCRMEAGEFSRTIRLLLIK